MWITASIAKVMKDVTNVEDLRAKLAAGANQEEEKIETASNPSNTQESQTYNHTSGQGEDVEEGWTPVAPGKATRRVQNRAHGSIQQPGELDLSSGGIGEQGVL
ncbi:unnamed protein product [Amaranthus hypochondriacus]